MTKSKSTKRALFSSVLALLLCFTMLLGTTFAWFTDDATSGVNTIQAGTLKVDLQDANGASLEGKNLSFANVDGSTEILWEPGATFQTQQFKIVNMGNLAMKYKIVLNGTEVSNNKLMEVLTFQIIDANGTEVDIDTFEANLTPAAASELYRIKATMNKNAGNAYQGLSCSNVSITVYATQYTYEKDMTDDQYDKDAEYADQVVYVSTPDELVSAFTNLKAGDVISLGADLDMTGKTITPVTGNKSFTLNGNGHKISNLSSTASALFVDHSGSSAYFFYDLTLDSCSVQSNDNYAALFVGDGDTSGNLTIENCAVTNCTVDGSKYAAMFIAFNSGYGVDNNGPVYGINNITNCTVTGGSVKGGGSTGVAVGHAGANDATENYITNLTINGVTITGEDSEHEGIVIGTAGVGITEISDIAATNVTTTNNSNTGIREYYGRNVPGTTGKLVINGEVQAATN